VGKNWKVETLFCNIRPGNIHKKYNIQYMDELFLSFQLNNNENNY